MLVIELPFKVVHSVAMCSVERTVMLIKESRMKMGGTICRTREWRSGCCMMLLFGWYGSDSFLGVGSWSIV